MKSDNYFNTVVFNTAVCSDYSLY